MTPFGFVAQIYHLHPDVIKNEKLAVQRIVLVLYNTIPFKIAQLGMIQAYSLQVLSYASRFRAATTTITGWRNNVDRLNQVRNDYAPFGWLAGKVHSNPWWDTLPAADYINDAFHAFCGKFGDIHAQMCGASPRVK